MVFGCAAVWVVWLGYLVGVLGLRVCCFWLVLCWWFGCFVFGCFVAVRVVCWV